MYNSGVQGTRACREALRRIILSAYGSDLCHVMPEGNNTGFGMYYLWAGQKKN